MNRTPLCHVLSLITRRQHVRLFRIQVLYVALIDQKLCNTILTNPRMGLTRQTGNDPPLVGLMRIYKDYYPDVIVGEVTSGRASVFTVSNSTSYASKSFLNETQHPNHEWRQRLGEIQDVYLQKTQDDLTLGQPAFRVTRRGANGAKRAKSTIVPEVHTSHAQEVRKSKS